MSNNNFRSFKIPIIYINEKSATKLDLYRYIIKSLYENYKKTDNYVGEEKTAIGVGAQEFLANLMHNGDDAILAYEDCLSKGHLKRHDYENKKNKDIYNTIYGLLSRCCKKEDELHVALYSEFNSVGRVFHLTPTPLYYDIKDFVNSLDGEEFTISNELVIVKNK